MSTTAFRDPRLLGLNSQDSSDPKNLSNQANDSIGWKDVQGENQEACCLGVGPSSSHAAPWAKSAPCTAIAWARKWARTERPRPEHQC